MAVPTTNPTYGGNDTTSSSSGGDSEVGGPDNTSLYVLLPLIILLIIVTLVGNITTMICVRVDKRLASTISSIYVFSLAIADSAMAIFAMTGLGIYSVYGYWPLGHLWCTIWVVVDYTCATVSMLHLCLVAYDRYEAVVNPIEYRTNHTMTKAAYRAVGAWSLGSVFWVIPVICFRVLAPGPDRDCFFVPAALFILLQTIVVYYTPMALMAIFYAKCLLALRDRYMKTAAAGGTDGLKLFLADEGTTTNTINGAQVKDEVQKGPDQVAVDPNAIVSQAKLSKQQQQLRSIRMLGVVMVVFLFCWVPFCLFWPILAYCSTCISVGWFEYSYWAAYLNSAINPYLYFASNRDFRHAFMTLIGRSQSE